MLDKRIEFDELFNNEEDGTTTIFFTAPKDLMKNFFLKSNVDEYEKEAESMEISLEFPLGNVRASTLISAEASPTMEIDGEYEDYDWWGITLSKSEIEELLKRAAYKHPADIIFDAGKYPKTYAYVLENDTKVLRCKCCGKVVLKETNGSEYPYQCMNCDENKFKFETYEGKSHSDKEFNELCWDTVILCLD